MGLTPLLGHWRAIKGGQASQDQEVRSRMLQFKVLMPMGPHKDTRGTNSSLRRTKAQEREAVSWSPREHLRHAGAPSTKFLE